MSKMYKMNNSEPVDVPMEVLGPYLEEVIPAFMSKFFTIDFIECLHGEWRVIECGDGQVSGLATEDFSGSFYLKLKQSLLWIHPSYTTVSFTGKQHPTCLQTVHVLHVYCHVFYYYFLVVAGLFVVSLQHASSSVISIHIPEHKLLQFARTTV